MFEPKEQATKEAAAEVLEDDVRDAHEARAEYSKSKAGKDKGHGHGHGSGRVGAMDAVFYSFRSSYRWPGDNGGAANAAVVARVELSLGAGAPEGTGYAIAAVRFGCPTSAEGNK
jgi:hypothetical protein